MDRRKEPKQRLIKVVLAFALVSLNACKGPTAEVEGSQVTAKQVNEISHMVFLALTNDAPRDSVVSDLLSLSEIPEVVTVNVVDRMDVDDNRALDYDLLLIAEFGSLEDLKKYDQDEFHQQVRAKLKPHLRLPPATFDYRPRE